MTEAYPLHWPEGWPRTRFPKRSAFKTDFVKARDHLRRQIELMGGRYVVISSNLKTRQDGYPLANQAEPSDSGVAAYFQRKEKQMVFACDKWDRARDNIRAIGMTIDAIRGMERWGASEMMERTFAAFEALPAPKSWRDILGLGPQPSEEEINAAFRQKARSAHPDAGGSNAMMTELTDARARAMKERNEL